MSSGDKGNVPFKYTLAEANKVIQLSQVDRYMRRVASINSHSWDIPYLAGYSKDGRTIYIDRDLQKWQWLGKWVNPTASCSCTSTSRRRSSTRSPNFKAASFKSC